MGKTISLVHYDIGNLLSIERALKHLGVTVKFARTAEDIMAAEKLLLPGVGAFESCKKVLDSRGLSKAIKDKLGQDNTPLLGICVGMQMLFDESEEFGSHKGFGYISGTVRAIDKATTEGKPHKIPHIGWSNLETHNHPNCILLDELPTPQSVYFIHSFSADNVPKENIAAHIVYGGHKIVAAVQKDNIYGTQFHPEKSGEIGLTILKNFVVKA